MIGGRYFERQLREIENVPGLHFYGLSLIFVHFLTSLYWFYKDILSSISPGMVSYCWPFFSSCDLVKIHFFPLIEIFFFLYFSLSVLGIFVGMNSVRRMWKMLFTLEVIKLVISSLDYQFMGNYHFMPHIITLVFLFIDRKRFWISIWLVTFYAAAATLKFNFEWLSGASLSWRIPFGSERILTLGAFVVPSIELLCPLMCLQKEPWLRRLGLFSLLLFHLVSYYWVGFFYPAVMTCLLSLWLVSPVTVSWRYLKEGVRSWQWSEKGLCILWILFVIIQLNVMRSPEKHALFGDARLWSLNMFDARAVCRGFFLIKNPDEIVEVDFKNETLPVRVHCDNLFFLEQARRLCETREMTTTPIEAHLISRPLSALGNYEIVREKDVCVRWDGKR